MKFLLPITTLIASALLATNVEAKFSSGLSWDYLIGAGTDVIKASNKQVVNIDLETANGLTSYLHGKGQKVICYFSGGTMQASRKVDYDDYLKAGVAIPDVSGWKNHYIDIRKKDKLYPLIKNRMQRAKSFGCDGVEVDSIGLYIHVKGYTKEDTITFGKWVAELAHSYGLSIGLKNVAGCAHALEPYFDFAIVESCAESPGVCSLYTPFIQHGKAVFTVHYGNRVNQLGSSPQSTLSKELGGLGFTCGFNKDQGVKVNTSNFDCSKGNFSSDSGSSPKPTTVTVTKTTTTTVKAESTSKSNPVVPNPLNTKQPNLSTASGAKATPGAQSTQSTSGAQAAQPTPGTPGAPGAQPTPGAPGAPGAAGVTTKQPANNANDAKKEVTSAVGGNKNNDASKKNEEEGGNGVGGIVVGIFAAGGVATAAVAGFVFLKKHKKFSSKDEEFSIDV